MPIIEAGCGVPGQNDGKKENCLFFLSTGHEPRNVLKAAYFTCDYLIIDEKRNLHLFRGHSEFLL